MGLRLAALAAIMAARLGAPERRQNRQSTPAQSLHPQALTSHGNPRGGCCSCLVRLLSVVLSCLRLRGALLMLVALLSRLLLLPSCVRVCSLLQVPTFPHRALPLGVELQTKTAHLKEHLSDAMGMQWYLLGSRLHVVESSCWLLLLW